MIKFRVKDEPQTVEDAELIKLVKDNEFLYNPKNPDYRNLPQRAVTWLSIAKELEVEDREFYQFLKKLFNFNCFVYKFL